MSNNDDLLNRLDQDFAPGWQPNPGDKICLTIEEISHRDGGWGLYPVISGTLTGTQGRTRDGLIDGRIAVHAVHGVLKGELEQRRPAIGDRIAIKYLGKQEGKKGGADYEGYKVAHDPQDGASAWASAPTPAPPAPTTSAPAPTGYVSGDTDPF